MNIDTEILQKVTTMPKSLKQELRPHAKYLMENYSKDISLEQNSGKKRRSGILKGTFVLPLPDDFDNTPSQEKMKTEHGYGNWAGQIIMSNDFDEPLEDLAEYM